MRLKEEWRPILSVDEGYEVSNLGRVRSWKNRLGFGRDPLLSEPVLLSIQTDRDDYLYIFLRKNGTAKRRYIHRLVAEAFIPNPYNKPEVNHEDGNKANCAVWNLYWATKEENMQHALKTGLWNPRETIQKHLESWRTPIYCYEKDCMYPSGEDAARDIGVTKAMITTVCQGKTHSAKGYHLCYVEEKEWLLRNIDRIKAIEKNKRKVKAINVDTGEERIYDSRQDASKDLGIPDSYISNIIAGRSYKTRGWTFENIPMEEIERRLCLGGHQFVSGI